MNNIAIIDLDSLAFYAGYGNKVINTQTQEPERDGDGRLILVDKTTKELEESCDYLMNKLLQDSKADSYIALIKGKGNYRKDISSTYKANRPEEPPKWWKTVKDYLISKWGANEINNIEVDDAVNILKNNYKDTGFICAIDRDLLGLEGKHFNWSKNEWIETSKDQAAYKFWEDMIAGQKGDNISGIPKKGAKFVEKLFKDVGIASYPHLVFREYLVYYGLDEGIKQYYINYNLLKILDNSTMNDLYLIQPIKVQIPENNFTI